MKLTQLELRKLINEEVKIIEKEKQQINEFAGGAIVKSGIKNLLKSAGLAIPGVDLILGSVIAGYDLINVKSSTDKVITDLPVIGNSIFQKLSASDDEWNEVLMQVQMLSEDERTILMGSFDELLTSLKNLVITIIQAYDSAAAAPIAVAAGAASVGTGAVATEVGTNLTTGLASLFAGVIPIEKFIFSLGTKIAGGLGWIFDFFKSSNPDKLIAMEDEGGTVVTSLISSPLQTFNRLGTLYDALHNPGTTALSGIKPEELISSFALTESRFIKLAGIK